MVQNNPFKLRPKNGIDRGWLCIDGNAFLPYKILNRIVQMAKYIFNGQKETFIGESCLPGGFDCGIKYTFVILFCVVHFIIN